MGWWSGQLALRRDPDDRLPCNGGGAQRCCPNRGGGNRRGRPSCPGRRSAQRRQQWVNCAIETASDMWLIPSFEQSVSLRPRAAKPVGQARKLPRLARRSLRHPLLHQAPMAPSVFRSRQPLMCETGAKKSDASCAWRSTANCPRRTKRILLSWLRGRPVWPSQTPNSASIKSSRRQGDESGS